MNAYFYFTKKERASWIIVCSMLLLIIFLPKYLFPVRDLKHDLLFSESMIDSLVMAGKQANLGVDSIQGDQSRNKNRYQNGYQKPANKFTKKKKKEAFTFKAGLFSFNPNKTPDDSIRLILPPFPAGNLIKYRDRGGVFYDATDVQKIYGMDAALFAQIKPYIRIPKKARKKSKKVYEKRSQFGDYQKKEVLKIDINAADTTELEKLPGIGRVFARRIIAFREALGGFHSVEQIRETYGLPEETVNRIIEQLEIRTRVLPIEINKVSEKELAGHPYVNWKQAKTICRYRSHHGKFTSINDLGKMLSLDSTFLEKIGPYLNFGKSHRPTGADTIKARDVQ